MKTLPIRIVPPQRRFTTAVVAFIESSFWSTWSLHHDPQSIIGMHWIHRRQLPGFENFGKLIIWRRRSITVCVTCLDSLDFCCFEDFQSSTKRILFHGGRTLCAHFVKNPQLLKHLFIMRSCPLEPASCSRDRQTMNFPRPPVFFSSPDTDCRQRARWSIPSVSMIEKYSSLRLIFHVYHFFYSFALLSATDSSGNSSLTGISRSSFA